MILAHITALLCLADVTLDPGGLAATPVARRFHGPPTISTHAHARVRSYVGDDVGTMSARLAPAALATVEPAAAGDPPPGDARLKKEAPRRRICASKSLDQATA
jgi:hypothetical protein